MIEGGIRFPAFIGREAELSHLTSCLHDARAGTGAVVLIAGPPGAGKTRLLAQFRSSLGARAGAFALGGNLHRHQASLSPFREALGDDFLTFVLDPSQPRIVAIDDLQWADDTSLELIGRVNRRIASLPILLLLTLQTPLFDSGELSPPLLNLLPRLTHRIVLDPLSIADVRALLKGVANHHPGLPPETTQRIERSAGGNPRYLEELLSASVRALDEPAGTETAFVPASLGAAVAQSLGALSEPSRALLMRAAALGASFDTRILGAVTGCGEAEIALALQAACERRLIVADGTSGERYAFSPPLVRDALYRSLTPAVSRLTHAAAAEAIERSAAAADCAAELSDHWFASGRCERSVDYARRAATQAEDAGDFAEAARFYKRVLQFVNEPDDERAEVCRKLGLALYFGGSVAQARRYFEESAAFFASAGSPQISAELLRSLASTLWHDGNGDAALAVVESALVHLSDCGDSIATCHLLVKAAGLCDLLGMRDRSLALLGRARAVPGRKPRSLRARYHNVRACCLAHAGTYSAAIEEFNAALRVQNGSRERDLAIAIYQNSSACLRSAGRFEEAEERARTALEYARKSHAGTLLESTLALVQADLLALRGKLPEATRLLERVVSPSPDFGIGRMQLLAFGLPVALAVERQDLVDLCFNEASVDAAFATRVSAGIGAVASAVSKMYTVTGDVKPARALLRRALRAIDTSELVEPLALAIAEYGAMSDFKRARTLLAVAPENLAGPAYLALFDAYVAHRAGKVRDRQRLAGSAAASFERLGAPLLAARAFELAGRQRRALETYRACGAVRDVNRLQRVFTGRGRRSAGVLTPRQIEIGRSIAAGQCNRAIARDLQISTKTLESHLTAIYRRLGIANRSGIAAFVLDRDGV